VVRQRTGTRVRALTTTEAAVLALLAIEGEHSGYDLLKRVAKAIGYVWSPARSQLYAVLPRLVEAGLASRRRVEQQTRPDKQLYAISDAGRDAVHDWLRTVESGESESFYLKLFVGGLVGAGTAIRQVEQFRLDVEERLAVLSAIEPTNSRRGHDAYHYFLLRLGIDRAELQLRWADWVLGELRRAEAE
jgi:PadR family transcriptional regulator, regulatory protein AphA